MSYKVVSKTDSDWHYILETSDLPTVLGFIAYHEAKARIDVSKLLFHDDGEILGYEQFMSKYS